MMSMLSNETPVFETYPQKYMCIQCANLLRKAMQLPCGHQICQTPCLETLFNTKDDAICPKAVDEDCKVQFNLNDVFKDMRIRKEIARMQVFCEDMEYECKDRVPLKPSEALVNGEMAQHTGEPPSQCSSKESMHTKTPQRCSYWIIGCKYEGSDDEITHHEKDANHHLNLMKEFNNKNIDRNQTSSNECVLTRHDDDRGEPQDILQKETSSIRNEIKYVNEIITLFENITLGPYGNGSYNKVIVPAKL